MLNDFVLDRYFLENKRRVKLVTRPVLHAAFASSHHWAVFVVDEHENEDEAGILYELMPTDDSKTTIGIRKITQSSYGVGMEFETVGYTSKSDSEITDYINKWMEKSQNKDYYVFGANCQKFALQLISWLTNGIYRIKVLGDGGMVTSPLYTDIDLKLESKNQTLIAKCIGKQIRLPYSYLMLRARGPYYETDVRRLKTDCITLNSISDPGIGLWGELSLFRLEVGIAGLISIHVSPNVDSGIGFRERNFNIHLFGFGGCLGADGAALDTCAGGIRLRILSWPINMITNWIGNGFDKYE